MVNLILDNDTYSSTGTMFVQTDTMYGNPNTALGFKIDGIPFMNPDRPSYCMIIASAILTQQGVNLQLSPLNLSSGNHTITLHIGSMVGLTDEVIASATFTVVEKHIVWNIGNKEVSSLVINNKEVQSIVVEDSGAILFEKHEVDDTRLHFYFDEDNYSDDGKHGICVDNGEENITYMVYDIEEGRFTDQIDNEVGNIRGTTSYHEAVYIYSIDNSELESFLDMLGEVENQLEAITEWIAEECPSLTFLGTLDYNGILTGEVIEEFYIGD